jgi:hypothetical protein
LKGLCGHGFKIIFSAREKKQKRKKSSVVENDVSYDPHHNVRVRVRSKNYYTSPRSIVVEDEVSYDPHDKVIFRVMVRVGVRVRITILFRRLVVDN